MIEKFNGIIYLILFLVHFIGFAYYGFRCVFQTQSFLNQYGMDATGAGVVRFLVQTQPDPGPKTQEALTERNGGRARPAHDDDARLICRDSIHEEVETEEGRRDAWHARVAQPSARAGRVRAAPVGPDAQATERRRAKASFHDGIEVAHGHQGKERVPLGAGLCAGAAPGANHEHDVPGLEGARGTQSVDVPIRLKLEAATAADDCASLIEKTLSEGGRGARGEEAGGQGRGGKG